MESVSQIEIHLKQVMEERACLLARQTRCIQRERKFTGADLLQTLVFGWMAHPDASLEQLASLATTREVFVSDTAIQKRFTEACAQFLHTILQELTQVVVQADEEVPLALLQHFSSIILEDSSSIVLPDELITCWRGCAKGGTKGQAAVKLHVRWELKRGQMQGPILTDGKASDRSSPFNEEKLRAKSLYIADLGYYNLDRMVARRRAKSYTLTRAQSNTAYFTRTGKRLWIKNLLPRRVGQLKEMRVWVGIKQHFPMRLMMLRVPEDIAEKRRKALYEDAAKKMEVVSALALELADWLLLLTDAPAKRLKAQEAFVLLRERWQMELLYKLWKQWGKVDEWKTTKSWRVLCEMYAKLIGFVLQHWLIVIYAWRDEQRSLVKLAQVIRDSALPLMEALAGHRSFSSVLQLLESRMRSGCRMNTRRKKPNSAQLLQAGHPFWLLSP